ncbi:hypothetical protein B5M09_004467 [Aphanomyces astaci]|uniref:Uncharacterized protein n=1 Tax=Aphanomyces astaci TaxID=112090 RepID=A0A3R7WPQ6_APHAT|nr:hypothetical protein B5M09_004467 [Aphanomyces astaci]
MWSKVVARHGGRPLSVRGIASSANALRFLIVDGYSPEGRLELTKSGVSIASDLYKRMLSTSADGLPTSFDVLFPSDGPFDTPDLRNYDAVAWTGCRFVAELEKLYEDPSRRDIAWRLGLDTDVMDENVRYTESRNFIKHLVVPYKLSKTLLE